MLFVDGIKRWILRYTQFTGIEKQKSIPDSLTLDIDALLLSLKLPLFNCCLDCGTLITARHTVCLLFCYSKRLKKKQQRKKSTLDCCCFFFLLFRLSETTFLFNGPVVCIEIQFRGAFGYNNIISFFILFLEFHSIRTLNKYFSIVVVIVDSAFVGFFFLLLFLLSVFTSWDWYDYGQIWSIQSRIKHQTWLKKSFNNGSWIKCDFFSFLHTSQTDTIWVFFFFFKWKWYKNVRTKS